MRFPERIRLHRPIDEVGALVGKVCVGGIADGLPDSFERRKQNNEGFIVALEDTCELIHKAVRFG